MRQIITALDALPSGVLPISLLRDVSHRLATVDLNKAVRLLALWSHSAVASYLLSWGLISPLRTWDLFSNE